MDDVMLASSVSLWFSQLDTQTYITVTVYGNFTEGAADVVTQIGSMVLQLFWKLVLIRGLWWNHLPVFGFFQHGTVPVVGTNRPEQNAILREYRCVDELKERPVIPV